MDQELQDRLDNIEKMVSDTNRMLIKMRRSQKSAAFRSLLYWVVIIAIAVASYYYIQPYIAKVQSTTNTIDSFIK